MSSNTAVKYSVGDTVKIVSEDSNFLSELGTHLGLTGTVTQQGAREGAYIKIDGKKGEWYFTDREIEPYKTSQKFKAGDTVRFRKADGSKSDFDGQEGLVTKVARYDLVEYTITKPAPGTPWINSVGGKCRMYPSDLELVVPKTCQEQLLEKAGLAIGDKANVVAGTHKGEVVTVMEGSDPQSSYIRGALPNGGNYPFLLEELSKVEPIKVGDWAKAVGYNPGGTVFEGWVGRVTLADGKHVTLAYDTKTYKYSSGTFPVRYIEPAEDPTPAPEPFKIGDVVTVKGYDKNPESVWEGRTGRITAFNLDNTVAVLDFTEFDNGYLGGGFDLEVLVPAKNPVPLFKSVKVGDRVELIEPYSGHTKGTAGIVAFVASQSDFGYDDRHKLVTVTTDAGRSLVAYAKRLKLSTAPVVKPKPVFKVGDVVELNQSYGGAPKGTFGVVTKVGDDDGDGIIVSWTTDGANRTLECFDYRLDLSDKTVTQKPWTETKPIGATAQKKFRSGKFSRIIVKLAEDKWLHIYQDNDGAADQTDVKSNETTLNLLGASGDNLTWITQ